MTLDQLRYFQAVCKYNSVSRASESLNISQPSVSNAISKLENEFGTMLFTRQNKRLVLTKEGAVLLELANDLLLNTDRTLKTMKELSDNKVLNLGIPPMLGSFILPILYGDFFQNNPHFKINIIEDDRTGLIQMLEDHRINMAFLPHEGPIDAHLKSQPLIALDNVCCVSKNHNLAQKEALTIEELKDAPLVLFKNSFFQTERILERFKQSGYAPNILLSTAQVTTMQNMAASGLAVGFLFQFLLESTPGLVGIPLDPPMRTQVSLVWKQGEHLSSNMHHLIQFVKKHFPGEGREL
ncbi:MAG: LysR family transcriptional regulator [Ruminococcaceae bacterium]|nr:LysR family transcriptional regulator [Oscillospiraceae bacterium]